MLTSDPDRIEVKLLLKHPEFRKFYKGNGSDDSAGETPSDVATEATPEEQIESAYQAVLTALRADILDRIGQNSPAFFERLIVDLLVAMGYGGSHKNAAAQLGARATAGLMA